MLPFYKHAFARFLAAQLELSGALEHASPTCLCGRVDLGMEDYQQEMGGGYCCPACAGIYLAAGAEEVEEVRGSPKEPKDWRGAAAASACANEESWTDGMAGDIVERKIGRRKC